MQDYIIFGVQNIGEHQIKLYDYQNFMNMSLHRHMEFFLDSLFCWNQIRTVYVIKTLFFISNDM